MAATIIEPWFTEEPFASKAREVIGIACCGTRKLWLLRELIEFSPPGDCVEVGVFRGGSALVLASCFPERTFHLFDTFEGMPETDPTIDAHKPGSFGNTSLEEVRTRLASCPNVRIYPGFFPDTAGPIRDLSFSFVHVDVDIRRSVADCCEFFWPRLNPGGVIVSDDYGHLTCAGAKLAFDEFFTGREKILRTDFGTAFVIKR